jgi:hypothetical protein
MNQSAAHDDDAFEFSLVRDDFVFRLQRRIGLIPSHGLGLIRRAIFWSMLAWLPIAAWAALNGLALPDETGESLLSHFSIHVRFLVAIPLLILAQGFAHAIMRQLLPYFASSGIVPRAEQEKFRVALVATARLRDAALPWVAIAGIVLAAALAGESLTHAHEIDWAVQGDAAAGPSSFGALWFLYVGRSIYLALVLAWMWRVALLFVLLRRIARLDLALVPTHPDRTGGLAFVERFPLVFAPVALAAGAVLASGWAHDAVYHGLSLLSLKVEMIAFVAIATAVFLAPLFAFAGPLKRARKKALLDYGALVGEHGRLVHQRWIEGRPLSDDAVLNAPELGPVADTAAIYDAVKAMRTVPFGMTAVVPVALAAAIPMLAALAIQIPIKALLLKLLKALI